MNRLIILLILGVVCIACQKELPEKDQKNPDKVYNNITKVWHFQKQNISPEVQPYLLEWKQWNSFENEIYQIPTATLTAYQQKSANLAKRVDSLLINIPETFNKPEVRSRIATLRSKIKALDMYMQLDSIPMAKTQRTVKEINNELFSLTNQWEEIIVKNQIPKEEGEVEMLKLLRDTIRRANPME